MEFDFNDLIKNAKVASEPVPDGDYNVKIVAADATVASTGSPMIKVKFELTEEPHIKRRVPSQFVVSVENPTALAIFFRNMKNIGLGEDFFASNPKMPQVAEALLNRMCRVTLNSREWQGVKMNNVAAILPLPATAGPLPPGTVTGPPVVNATGVPSPSATPSSTPTPTNQPKPSAGPPVPAF